jgi:hypothetical protein
MHRRRKTGGICCFSTKNVGILIGNLILFRAAPGLPDFSLYNIPTWGKMHKITTKHKK